MRTNPFCVICSVIAVVVVVLLPAGCASATSAGRAEDSPVTKINLEAANADVTVQQLRGNISVLMGSGGNIGVLAGESGKLMVDAGIGVSRHKLSVALDRIGPGPVKLLINTHWHWDHTDGNEWLNEGGATVVAHGNTLQRLSNTVRIDDWNFTFQPVPEGARPTSIVNSTRTLDFGGDVVEINYYGPSHTDGDLWVYFTKADVLVTGDTWWNGHYPFIDSVTGGSIDGMIRAAEASIARSTDKTIIIPGHGPVGGRLELIEFRDMLVSIRGNVARLKQQGKSLDEIIAAKPTADYDAKWGGFVIGPDFFVRLVYRGV